MKKILTLFITIFTLLSCTSNDENLIDETKNNEIYTVKVTFAKDGNSSPFNKIKFEGLPIKEQNNKWMPTREDIRYDETNDHIEFLTRWETDNNTLYFFTYDDVNNVSGEYWTNAVTFKSKIYNFIEVLPNELFWKTKVENWDNLSTFKIGVRTHLVDFDKYFYDNNFEGEFSFEIKIQLK